MHNDAINGDRVARERFSRLVQDNNIRSIVETGTYHGITTDFLSSLCDNVHSIEIDPRYLDISKVLIGDNPNIHLYLGDSPTILTTILPNIPGPIFFFLDSHWGGYCPLIDELQIIAEMGVRDPVIAIHDFLVPGTDLGYDVYNEQALSFDYVEPKLSHLYPKGFKTEYNDATAEGSRRGILYLTPADR